MGSKKRIAIIGVSSIVLVAIGVAVSFAVLATQNDVKNQSKGSQISSSQKAVQAICQSVDYKKECVRALKDVNSTDPHMIVQQGFKAAMKHLSEAAKKSTTLKELEKDPKAARALSNCRGLMNDAIGELEASLKRLDKFDLASVNRLLEDMKTWLSAAETYQETCLDQFENITSNAGKKMQEILKSSKHLTSNGLAMVYGIQSAVGNLVPKRRLLSDGTTTISGAATTWMPEPSKRKLLSKKVSSLKHDFVVAKDGSGQFKTINEAVKKLPVNSKKTIVLYIKEGIYNEHVVFEKNITNLLVVGDGPTKTRIVYNLNYIDGIQTFKTATVAALGDHFMAKDIGFENNAGPIKHQAVALRVGADFSVFYNCHMDGYQDTLYVHTKRQFYRDCTITGTIDFVFGNAAAVFQNCKLLVRRPLENQMCIVTAQGRKERRQPSAIVLQNCTISGDESLMSMKNKTLVRSFLGRPWKEHSRTIVVESYIDSIIDPEGWLPWMGTFALDTCFYAEVNNRGPGADKDHRVKWKGIKKIDAEHVKSRYTVNSLYGGDLWIKGKGVPYETDLMNIKGDDKDK